MIKKYLAITVISVSMLMTGCSGFDSGLPTYESSADDIGAGVNKAVEGTIDKIAKEKHVPPELSDDFCSKYLDMDSLEELKIRVKNGTKITQDLAGLTQNEINLWKQIVKNAEYNQYTTEDLDRRIEEYKGIVENLAKEHELSVEQYLNTDEFQMTVKEYEDFLHKMAEKFKETDEEVTKQMQEQKGQ